MGSNAQEAACQPVTALNALASSGAAAGSSGYAFGQTLTVVGSIPPAAAGLKVRGQLVLPVGVLSAECMDLQQVGFMTRVPASLKVGHRGWVWMCMCGGHLRTCQDLHGVGGIDGLHDAARKPLCGPLAWPL